MGQRRILNESAPFLLPMRRRFFWVLLLLLAAAVRLPHVDWDDGLAAHPDEQYLLGQALATPLWGDPCAQGDFPYGALPLYAARALVLVAPTADPLYPARLISGLLGVLLVALTGALGRVAAGGTGYAAAAGIAVAPLLLQTARFYTVDPWVAVTVTGSVWAVMRRRWMLAGALAGASLACKLSAGWVLLPLGYAAWSAGGVRRGRLLRMGAAALGVFTLLSPWAWLRPVACWRGPLVQAGMAAGRFDFPYTRQYAGTWPYLYPLAQMAWWGLGVPLTLGGVWGWAQAAWRWRRQSFSARVLLVWTGVYFLAMGGLYVKFPRYLLPLYPAWAVWAMRRRPPVWRGVAIAWAALLGAAQLSLYAAPHPWVQASRWLYAHVPAGSTLAVESWDHPLPIPLSQGTADRYRQVTVPVFAPASADKVQRLAEASRQAEVIVFASRRGYGALSRRPQQYRATLAWYRAVLTTRRVVAFGRCPHLGPLSLSDDPLAEAHLPTLLPLSARCGTRYALRLPRLDESFRVYDAPSVLLALK